jgi:CheY-like chemotaxis protein
MSPLRGHLIKLLYLDDDERELARFARRIEHSVENPVATFRTSRALFDYLDADKSLNKMAIIVDLVLGDESGYAVIAQLRVRYPELERNGVPIIAVTRARNMDANQAHADTADMVGADVYVRKPITLEDLTTALGKPGWYKVQFVAPHESEKGHDGSNQPLGPVD